jgi:hypothetical protein
MAPHEFKEGFQKSYAQAREAWQKTLSRPDANQVEHGNQ